MATLRDRIKNLVLSGGIGTGMLIGNGNTASATKPYTAVPHAHTNEEVEVHASDRNLLPLVPDGISLYDAIKNPVVANCFDKDVKSMLTAKKMHPVIENFAKHTNLRSLLRENGSLDKEKANSMVADAMQDVPVRDYASQANGKLAMRIEVASNRALHDIIFNPAIAHYIPTEWTIKKIAESSGRKHEHLTLKIDIVQMLALAKEISEEVGQEALAFAKTDLSIYDYIKKMPESTAKLIAYFNSDFPLLTAEVQESDKTLLSATLKHIHLENVLDAKGKMDNFHLRNKVIQSSSTHTLSSFSIRQLEYVLGPEIAALKVMPHKDTILKETAVGMFAADSEKEFDGKRKGFEEKNVSAVTRAEYAILPLQPQNPWPQFRHIDPDTGKSKTVIPYSYNVSANVPVKESLIATRTDFSEQQKEVNHYVLQKIERLSGNAIEFREVDQLPVDEKGNAQGVLVYSATMTRESVGGIAAGSLNPRNQRVDVAVNDSDPQTIAHEWGHAMGLFHPHEMDNGRTPLPGTEGTEVPGINKNETDMSYTSADRLDFTLAPADIAALATIYGFTPQADTGKAYTLAIHDDKQIINDCQIANQCDTNTLLVRNPEGINLWDNLVTETAFQTVIPAQGATLDLRMVPVNGLPEPVHSTHSVDLSAENIRIDFSAGSKYYETTVAAYPESINNAVITDGTIIGSKHPGGIIEVENSGQLVSHGNSLLKGGSGTTVFRPASGDRVEIRADNRSKYTPGDFIITEKSDYTLLVQDNVKEATLEIKNPHTALLTLRNNQGELVKKLQVDSARPLTKGSFHIQDSHGNKIRISRDNPSPISR